MLASGQIQLSPSDATTSAGLRWPYKAGGLCRGGTCSSSPTVNVQRMRPHMRGGLWRGGPYKRGTNVVDLFSCLFTCMSRQNKFAQTLITIQQEH